MKKTHGGLPKLEGTYYSRNKELCKRRAIAWIKSHPEKRKEYQKKARGTPIFNARQNQRNALNKAKDPLKWVREAMLRQARSRAKRAGLPFSIVLEDIIIPELCPVLDIPLVPGTKMPHAGSPSLDKFIPSLGYVPGNIYVISRRANTMKSDGSVEDVRKLLAWMESQ